MSASAERQPGALTSAWGRAGVLGRVVVDRDGRRLGAVADLYVTTRGGVPTWLVVDLGSRTALVPVEAVGNDGAILGVGYDAAVVHAAPAIDAGAPLPAAVEADLRLHYALTHARPGTGTALERWNPAPELEGAVSMNAIEARRLRAATVRLKRSSSVVAGPSIAAQAPVGPVTTGGREAPGPAAGRVDGGGVSPEPRPGSGRAATSPGIGVGTDTQPATRGEPAGGRRARRSGRRRRPLVLVLSTVIAVVAALAVTLAVRAASAPERDRDPAAAGPSAQPLPPVVPVPTTVPGPRLLPGGEFEDGIAPVWRAAPGTLLRRVNPGHDSGWAVAAAHAGTTADPGGRGTLRTWPRGMTGLAADLPAGPATTVRVLAWARLTGRVTAQDQTVRMRLVEKATGRELASSSQVLPVGRDWTSVAVGAQVPGRPDRYEVQVGVVDPDPREVLELDGFTSETGTRAGD
jgi:hypothetical protein